MPTNHLEKANEYTHPVLYLAVLLILAGLATLNYGVNPSEESSNSFCAVTEEHNQQYRTVVPTLQD